MSRTREDEEKGSGMKQHTDLCGIVLAGVQTWGECPLDCLFPRPLLPVVGRPLLTYGLAWLAAQNVTRAVICANSDTATFHRLLGNGDAVGLSLDYYQDRMPRGPAGCVFDAGSAADASTFVVINGALVTDLDLDLVLTKHREMRAAVTVVASRRNGKANRDAEILEPAGIYVVSRSALQHVPPTAYQDIKEMWLPKLHASGQRVMPFVAEAGGWAHVSGPASYIKLHEWVLSVERRAWEGGPEYRHVGDARVHKSVRLAPGVRLMGSCVIGPWCQIESGVCVFGPTVIGASNVLAKGAVVNRSIIWSNCRISSGAVIDRSVIGNGNIIGSSVVLRNQVAVCDVLSSTGSSAPGETYWAMETAASPPHSSLLPRKRVQEFAELQLG